MAILDFSEITQRLYSDIDVRKKLYVTPILNKEKQINNNGIDLRLSNQFIVFRPENISHYDLKDMDPSLIRKFQKHISIPFFKKFVLHPKTLVLASTLEYVSLPEDVWGLLEGRSSFARLGLIIATASSIDPGYKGCITLELTNLGNLPLCLYPGIRIGQLIFSTTSFDFKNKPKPTKYDYQVGPEFCKIHEDSDLSIFCPS